MTKLRYKKNCGSFMYEDMAENMLNKTIAIIGMGGIGGYVSNFFARFGVKKLIMFDGDRFEESNLSCKYGATEHNLGCNKAKEVTKLLKQINSEVEYVCYDHYFGEYDNDYDLITDADIIVFAADNQFDFSKSTALIYKAIENGYPVADCAVTARGGQIAIITKEGLPKYKEVHKHAIITSDISQPAYTCALMSALMVSNIIKYFAKEQSPCINQMLDYDTICDKLHRIDFNYGQLY